MNEDIKRGIIITLIIIAIFIGFSTYLKITPIEVEEPNVIGMKLEQAQKEIEKAGLKMEVDTKDENSYNSDSIVIDQDPRYLENYNKVKKGSTIKVKVEK